MDTYIDITAKLLALCNQLCRLFKHIIDTNILFGWRLEKMCLDCPCIFLRFLPSDHLTFININYINFGSDNEFYAILLSFLLDLFSPKAQIAKTFIVSNIVDKTDNGCLFVIDCTERAKFVLARCIPQLQTDFAFLFLTFGLN